jgi:hypothetical protein
MQNRIHDRTAMKNWKHKIPLMVTYFPSKYTCSDARLAKVLSEKTIRKDGPSKDG